LSAVNDAEQRPFVATTRGADAEPVSKSEQLFAPPAEADDAIFVVEADDRGRAARRRRLHRMPVVDDLRHTVAGVAGL
jgi:hypothetical protein